MIRSSFKLLLMLVVLGMLTGAASNSAKAQDLPQYTCRPVMDYPKSGKRIDPNTFYTDCTLVGPIDEKAFRSWAKRVYKVDFARKPQNLVIGWQLLLDDDRGQSYCSDSGVIVIKGGKFELVETPEIRTKEAEAQRMLDEKLLRYLEEQEVRYNKKR